MGGRCRSEAAHRRAKGCGAHLARLARQTCLQAGSPFRFPVFCAPPGTPVFMEWLSRPIASPRLHGLLLGGCCVSGSPPGATHSEAPGLGLVRSSCAGAVLSLGCCLPGSLLPATGLPCPARRFSGAPRPGMRVSGHCPLAPVPVPVSAGCSCSESPRLRFPPARGPLWAARVDRAPALCALSVWPASNGRRPCLCPSWSAGSFSGAQRRACPSGS